MKTPNQRRVGRVATVLGAAVFLLAACSSSTDPGGGGGEVEITFSPAAADLTLTVGASQELRATVTGTDQAAIAWSVGAAPVASGPVYVHAAAAVGVDTVSVVVDAGGRTAGRAWRIAIEPDASQLPPVVAGVTIGHGPAPGEVTVSWLRASATHFPLADYLVACSYAGPVTVANWDQAILLGTYPHDPAVLQNRRTFGEDAGMVPGAAAWFAVRARDDRGQLSPVDAVFAHTISYAWTLEVLVVDDAGGPLQSVILNHDAGEPVTTDASGRAAIGPLRSVDTVTVSTNAEGHFDFDAAPAGVGDPALRLVLPAEHAPGHESCDINDPADFLAYVRAVTLTDGANQRPTVLHKWDSYPLAVWIPAATSATLGWDLQALAAAAVPVWNEALQQDYLVAAADSASADIVLAFRDLPDPYRGLTRVLAPGGGIGESIPVQMECVVESVLDQIPDAQQIWVTEIALHELGHALGHYGHTCMVNEGNLMDSGGAIGRLAGGPAGAVNPDELRLVRLVRELPQGTDMARYVDR